MSDLKEKIEKFIDFSFKLSSTIINSDSKLEKENLIENSNWIQNISKELEKELQDTNFLSDEDLEKFDDDFKKQLAEIDNLKERCKNYQEQAKSYENSMISNSQDEKKWKMEIEVLKDKIKFFNKDSGDLKEQNSSLLEKINLLETEIAELNSKLNQLTFKYNNLLDENEINNKNLKKNFQLERQVKELNEELECLKAKIPDLNEHEEHKRINERFKNEIFEYKKEIECLKTNESNYKKDLEKLKEENFNKFEKINLIENELRLKKLQNKDLINEIETLNCKVKELTNSKEEIEKSISSKRLFYENKIKSLQNELESQISKTNLIEADNIKLKADIEHYSHLSSMAMKNKDKLTKKDFSILEVMSGRVEELENKYGELKDKHSILSENYNKLIKEKQIIEKNIFDFLKEEINVSPKIIEKIENKNKFNTDELEKEDFSLFKINTLTNQVLVDSIILQKKENRMLKDQVAELAIEINKLMRSGK